MNTISIVIPVYNRAHIVERTLQSVLAQQYRPLQVVLVDNDSNDNSLDVLENWAATNSTPDFEVCVVTEAHRTAGAARNRGASVATGDWLIFFDSDDEMHPRLVTSYVEAVNGAGDEVDIVSTGATLRWPDGSKQALPFHSNDIMAVQILNSQLATQRYMVRASFFHACDEWNINLPVWNDWELGIRMLLANPRMTYVNRRYVTVNHSGEASITGNAFASKAGQWERVISIAEVEVITSARHDKLRLQRLLEFKRIILAAQYQREGEHARSVKLCNRAFNRLRRSYDAGLKWKLLVAPVVKRLFARTVKGGRGAATIARHLF